MSGEDPFRFVPPTLVIGSQQSAPLPLPLRGACCAGPEGRLGLVYPFQLVQRYWYF